MDLNEASPEIVIEASLTDQPGSVKVEISETVNYFGEFSKQPVSGASVRLKDARGKSFQLREAATTAGFYTNEMIIPEVGSTYVLTVEVNGKTYEAASILHPAVEIEHVSYFFEAGTSIFDTGYYMRMVYQDPEGEENYYRVNIYKNGRLRTSGSDLILFSDRFVEGKQVEVTLHSVLFKKGSLATVELISLDKKAFDFYRTFTDLNTNNPGSAAPANPTSNFSNGALGFFSAWTFDEESIVIEEK